MGSAELYLSFQCADALPVRTGLVVIVGFIDAAAIAAATLAAIAAVSVGYTRGDGSVRRCYDQWTDAGVVVLVLGILSGGCSYGCHLDALLARFLASWHSRTYAALQEIRKEGFHRYRAHVRGEPHGLGLRGVLLPKPFFLGFGLVLDGKPVVVQHDGQVFGRIGGIGLVDQSLVLAVVAVSSVRVPLERHAGRQQDRPENRRRDDRRHSVHRRAGDDLARQKLVADAVEAVGAHPAFRGTTREVRARQEVPLHQLDRVGALAVLGAVGAGHEQVVGPQVRIRIALSDVEGLVGRVSAVQIVDDQIFFFFLLLPGVAIGVFVSVLISALVIILIVLIIFVDRLPILVDVTIICEVIITRFCPFCELTVVKIR